VPIAVISAKNTSGLVNRIKPERRPITHLTYIFNSEIKSLPFFKAVTGIDFFWDNLSYMFIVAGGYLFIYTALTFLNKGIAGRYGNTQTPYWICFSGFLALFIIFRDTILWMDLMRPLPLILIAYLGVFIYRWFYCSQTPQDKRRQISVFCIVGILTDFIIKNFFKGTCPALWICPDSARIPYFRSAFNT